MTPDQNQQAIFAANLQRLRLQQSLTQKKLAAACFIAQPRVSDFERMNGDPKLSQITDLAKALGVTVVDLLEN